ncbi:MAG: RdgB/HAM1 family non-canonical purine NTP pyrophosphatase [Oscillospiraceae bacterium]
MKLIAATQNIGKLNEFERILAPLGFEIISLQEAGVDIAVEETGSTFAENSKLKAMAIFKATGIPAIADDSGLCVEAMQLRPGVYSARYCGENSGYDVKIKSLIKELDGIPKEKRTAYFESAICLVVAEDKILECSGRSYGWIGFEPQGTEGFGYDPIFMLGNRSYAQMAQNEKDAVSHRGIALTKLYKILRNAHLA